MHIYRKTTKRIGFNFKNIILGEMPFTKDNIIINFVILYTKQYIFSCLLQCKKPNFLGLINHLKLKYNIKRCVSINNSKLSFFDKKWDSWKKMFESN